MAGRSGRAWRWCSSSFGKVSQAAGGSLKSLMASRSVGQTGGARSAQGSPQRLPKAQSPRTALMARPSRSWASQFAFRIFVYASAVVAARKALEKATRSQTEKSIPGRGTPSRRSLPLLHGRDRELGIFLHARRPARSDRLGPRVEARSEEHTSELQSLMRISSAVFCL